MDIAGYLAAILIGISLGLIGGGGSILTVPVLVYLFHVNAVVATTYSLFIVGATSFIGSITYFHKQLVDLKTAMIFGVPSIGIVYITRQFIVPAIPQVVFSIDNLQITKSILLLLLFAVLMIAASYSMIKKSKQINVTEPNDNNTFNYPLIIVQGVAIGFLTGLVGAGGGFLIIPALVSMLNMPMKKAIGTSLVIITINSLSGFLFSLSHTVIQWQFLCTVSAIAIVGIVLGSYLSTKVDGKKLKPAFGWFVLIMGLYIIIKETIL